MTHYAIMKADDGTPYSGPAEIFPNITDAIEYLDQCGLNHDIFAIEPIPESARWEWSHRRPGSPNRQYPYTTELAARSTRPPNHELIRRRRGATEWAVVEPAEYQESS